MAVETLQMLSLVAYVAAGVMLLVSIAMLFLLDIPKVFGEITGKTAKKAIEEIRKQNQTDKHRMDKSSINASHISNTAKITESGRLNIRTGNLSDSPAKRLKTNETTVLDCSETTILTGKLQMVGETTVLTSEHQTTGDTTVLQDVGYVQAQQYDLEGLFVVEAELFFAVSTELIE